MIAYSVGHPLPEPAFSQIRSVRGDRAFAALNGAGALDIYVVLGGIAPKEKRMFGRTMEIVLHGEFTPAIMTLIYENMSFDVPLILPSPPSGNAVTIFLVEENDTTLQHIRTLGLSEEIFDAIVRSIERCKGKSRQELAEMAQTAYVTFSPGDMEKGGLRQRFER